MTLRIQALDPLSEVVDKNRRWNTDWYGYISNVNRIGNVGDLPRNRVDPVTGQPTKDVVIGERAFVLDATAVTFGSVVVGGGSNRVPVYFDGSVWRIG